MPIAQADGCLLWEGVMIDISDLKQRELELQQRQQELPLTLDNLPIPLGSTRIDGDQSIVFFNRCFSETFGYGISTVPNVTSWMQQACAFVCAAASTRPAGRVMWSRLGVVMAASPHGNTGSPVAMAVAAMCCSVA